ncbi:hypothetical protein ACFV7Q_13220 [Streptomyces sp. NPDC059851]|uniref:hypothetical protein n=1 Tax=Streptomyces sp. NPDC059851 TaxID=3346971 RepID=UPI00365944E3
MPPTFRHLAACAVLPVLLLCGGCAGGGTAVPQGSGPAAGASTAPSASPAARPDSFQDIAAVLGCTPEITVDAEEIREGACGTGPQAYRMATFSTEEGRSAWLTEARVYGGTYLVGPRWVVTAATPEALGPLRDRLGGTLESGAAHGAGSTPGPAESPGQGSAQGSAPHAGHPSP